MVHGRCLSATTVAAACAGLVDDLHASWDLPSVYLLVDGRLRCQASRGYYQVSDGFPPGVGVIGRTITSGTTVVVEDVTQDPAFIAAIPGLRSEVCVPLYVHGAVVGAVNVESTEVLGPDAVADCEAAAAALGTRIEELGGLPAPTLPERLGRIAVTLAEQRAAPEVAQTAVAAARELSGLGTAALVRRTDDGWAVVHATGALAELVRGWDDPALQVLSSWVWSGTSSHFPSGEADQATADVLGSALRALSVQPLVVGGSVIGMLLQAGEQPVEHDPAVTAALELLAALTAATLTTLATVDDLVRQAGRDPLTGLGNRRVLQEALDGLDRRTEGVCLVLLDLDGFKGVNDLHGHAEGDALLVAVAERLTSHVRDGDLVCRLGGDEFAVLLRNAPTEAAGAELARRLVAAVTGTRTGEGAAPIVGASAGVRHGGGRVGDLLADADAALYVAKRAGRGSVAVWDPGMRQRSIERRALVDDLLQAIGTPALRMVYQPVVSLGSRRVVGVEALARWTHPVHGAVPPSSFVAAAEQAGVVASLTRWVLDAVCRQAAAWSAALKVGVNVSASQLGTGDLVSDVRDALTRHGVPPHRLVLEVTETAAPGSLAQARSTLEQLRDLGVTLALDDFGTGHASLTHAHALPYDILKVDRSFVRAAAEGDVRATATIAAVGALATRLGVDVVAEGVEHLGELAGLTELGCGFAQGFALSRPLEPADVTAALAHPGGWSPPLPPVVPLPRRVVVAH